MAKIISLLPLIAAVAAELNTLAKLGCKLYLGITASTAALAIAKSATVVVGVAPSILTLADHKYTSACNICDAPNDHCAFCILVV